MRSVVAGEGAYPRLFAGFAGVNCVPGSFGLVLPLLESKKSPKLLAPALPGSVLQRKFAVHRSTERRFRGLKVFQQRKKCLDAALRTIRTVL